MRRYKRWTPRGRWRRRRGSRFPFRKLYFRRKKRPTGGKGVFQYKKFIRNKVEVKHKDALVNLTTTDTDSSPGLAGPFPSMAQGVTHSTRVGMSINIKGLSIRGKIKKVAIGSDTNEKTFARLIVFVYKRYAGHGTTDVISYSDILESSGMLAPFNFYDRERIDGYKVIVDKTYGLTDNTLGTGTFEQNVNIHVPLSLKCTYDDGLAPASGEWEKIQQGGIGMFVISNSTATHGPTCNFQTRITYTDP